MSESTAVSKSCAFASHDPTKPRNDELQRLAHATTNKGNHRRVRSERLFGPRLNEFIPLFDFLIIAA